MSATLMPKDATPTERLVYTFCGTLIVLSALGMIYFAAYSTGYRAGKDLAQKECALANNDQPAKRC